MKSFLTALCLVLAVFLVSTTTEANAQTKYPRVSQSATVMQTIGDTDLFHKRQTMQNKALK